MTAEIDRKAVGRRVRKARDALGLTQSQLALALDVGPALLSHYELGRRLLPVDIAIRLAQRSRSSLDALYGFKPRRQR